VVLFDFEWNVKLIEPSLDLTEKIRDKLFGGFEAVWAAFVVMGPMPMIGRHGAGKEPIASRTNGMCIVESQ
jgi:hypothetical protein